MAPKRAARVIRYEQMVGRLTRDARAGRSTHGSDLAADTGYSDRAHLIRDSRAFAGTTPAEFHRRSGGELGLPGEAD